MNNKELQKSVFLEIKREKLNAETIADKNLEEALKNETFKNLYSQIKKLKFDIAKKEFLNAPTSEDKKELKSLVEKIKKTSKDLGFQLSQFKPNYSCKICNDTGLVNNEYCKCFYQKLNKAIINNLGIIVDNTHTFNNSNFSIFSNPEKIKTIYSKIQNWCETLPASQYKTIVISGNTGVGKTYLIDCVCNNLIQKNMVINYYTSFALNNLFLKYRTNLIENNAGILDGVLNCDVLIVDDLGSEPNLKNNEEFFYLLFNERLVKNKFTIITTNLLPAQIMDRYGERTFSRLFNKKSSISIKMENEDLRIKK